MVTEGQPAPAFTRPSDTGEEVSLASLRGQPVVLYVDPKDDTPVPIWRNRPQTYLSEGGPTISIACRAAIWASSSSLTSCWQTAAARSSKYPIIDAGK